MAPKYTLPSSSSLEFQTHVAHCLLDISTWLSNGPHILNLSKMELLLPFLWSHNLPISGNSTPFFQWVRPQNLELSLSFLFSLSYLIPKPQKMQWTLPSQHIHNPTTSHRLCFYYLTSRTPSSITCTIAIASWVVSLLPSLPHYINCSQNHLCPEWATRIILLKKWIVSHQFSAQISLMVSCLTQIKGAVRSGPTVFLASPSTLPCLLCSIIIGPLALHGTL